jgi:hypothetical protein
MPSKMRCHHLWDCNYVLYIDTFWSTISTPRILDWYYKRMGDVGNSTRSWFTQRPATHLPMANGFVAVDIINTSFRSTQQMATTLHDLCIFTVMVPRGGRLVAGNPAKDARNPRHDFRTMPVVQNPRAIRNIHNWGLLKKLFVTMTWPRFSIPLMAIRTASSPTVPP